MEREVKILGFAGSLRAGSYNKGLLRAALKVLPGGASLEIFDLQGISPFNQDQEKTPPERAREFKTKIKQADAILIATPENNYTVPGVLMNAIAWASRPYGDNAFEEKPVAVMSASIGMLGGARAQYHLRQSFVFLNMVAVNRPEVMVPFAQDKFDKDGNLQDEKASKLIKELLEALVVQARRMKA